MGRRITIIILSIVLITVTGFVLYSCDPIDLRLWVEERVDAAGGGALPVIDIGIYPEYVPNGSALLATASDADGDTLTFTWTEVSSHGVIFGDAEAGDSTISYDNWSGGEVVIEITLKLMVSDGIAEVEAEVTIRLYNTDIVFVTTSGSGDGSSPNSPRGSDINTAITYASMNSKSAVAIASGLYSGSSGGTTFVVLSDNISLYGAYDETDWSRDLYSNITIIRDTSSSGGTALWMPNNTTTATIVDGLRIEGADVSGPTMALAIGENSNPVIRNCAIIGGSGGTSSAYGIRIGRSSSPTIYNNTIFGGTSGPSYAIYCQGDFTYPTSPIIRNNTIDGGNVGSAASTFGIYIVSEGYPDIQNNIIFTTDGMGYGIYETTTGCVPSSVEYNDIFDCSAGLYWDAHTPSYNPKTEANLGTFTQSSNTYPMASPTGIGNISIDPFFQAGGNDVLHLGSGTQSSILTGGIDGSAAGWGFDTDKDGNPRTGNGSTGWSMGAYEYDP